VPPARVARLRRRERPDRDVREVRAAALARARSAHPRLLRADPRVRGAPRGDLVISVVLPAFDEEATIVATVNGMREVLEANALTPFEITVVADGSTAATARLAAEAGARVLSHPHNVGYGRSLKDGIEAASHDTIVIADADGTYPAGAVPQLVQEY